jgi:predicted patatin/cPLA2 family phospholipase
MTANEQDLSQTDKGLGLVLEGGAQRGLFSAGVIDVLMENDIAPDGLIGVSAGAAFGCNMKSRQPGRCIRYNKRFARDWRYCSLRSLITTGDLFGGDFCYHQLPKHLDVFDADTFERNPMEFYAVCTDVDTGKAVYKQLVKVDNECMEWIRASASMPVASKIVTINGQRLLDGGIADSIPLRKFQTMGYRRNIVVLTQPRNFVKTPNKMNPLINFVLRKYPHFIEASNNRHLMYNEELAYVRQEERKGNTLVLAPDEKLPINHVSHDADLMQRVYELGRSQATRRLDEIISFIRK